MGIEFKQSGSHDAKKQHVSECECSIKPDEYALFAYMAVWLTKHDCITERFGWRGRGRGFGVEGVKGSWEEGVRVAHQAWLHWGGGVGEGLIRGLCGSPRTTSKVSAAASRTAVSPAEIQALRERKSWPCIPTTLVKLAAVNRPKHEP